MDKHHVIPLITEAEIAARMATLAREIAASVGTDIMVVSLLKGSFMFTADLIRALHHAGVRTQVDFMTLSSYGARTESSGSVNLAGDMGGDISGKDVLIVDDILESGRTLDFAARTLKARGATTVKIAVLLEKPGKLQVPMEADFIGFTIPDKFVVGYGLDYANHYRELPYVGVVSTP